MAVEPTTVVWTEDPNRPLPAANKTGRPRQYPSLEALPRPRDLRAVAEPLPPTAWRTVAWREGRRGVQRSRFARLPVWAAHGWRAQEHPLRVPEWLLVEWPPGAETPRQYWLAQLAESAPGGMRRLVRLARARWRVELDYRQLKDELGLDHFEGRHWLGWHHHVCLVSMAYASWRFEQARRKKNFWCDLDSAQREEASARPAD